MLWPWVKKSVGSQPASVSSRKGQKSRLKPEIGLNVDESVMTFWISD